MSDIATIFSGIAESYRLLAIETERATAATVEMGAAMRKWMEERRAKLSPAQRDHFDRLVASGVTWCEAFEQVERA